MVSFLIQHLRTERTQRQRKSQARRRAALKQGVELKTQLEVDAAYETLAHAFKTIEKTFKRLDALEMIEDALVNRANKTAGRNRLSLRYGKE